MTGKYILLRCHLAILEFEMEAHDESFVHNVPIVVDKHYAADVMSCDTAGQRSSVMSDIQSYLERSRQRVHELVTALPGSSNVMQSFEEMHVEQVNIRHQRRRREGSFKTSTSVVQLAIPDDDVEIVNTNTISSYNSSIRSDFGRRGKRLVDNVVHNLSSEFNVVAVDAKVYLLQGLKLSKSRTKARGKRSKSQFELIRFGVRAEEQDILEQRIISRLKEMIDTYNPIAQVFKNARDRLQGDVVHELKLSNSTLKDSALHEFTTPESSSKSKMLEPSDKEMEDILGLRDFDTPKLSSSKENVHIKSEF
ncbi:hypothetical protein RIF29_39922 [Crotalaria pallida]|uniref:Uncharacterized protein n=1 Tax=Crotalaria pallida TaxID=3830 RepID=A0AAN9E237_CROPI